MKVIKFLTILFRQGLGNSAINTARSAISAVVKSQEGTSIGSERQIVRFMKGVFELRTPLPKYDCVWDVGILLNYFRQQKSDKDLTFKGLSLKLGALLLLTSAQRIQAIHLICISWITFTKQGVSIQIRGN